MAGGLRSLHGKHHRLFLPVQQFDVHPRQLMRTHDFGVARGVRRVPDEQVALPVEPVHVRVIDDAALLVAEQRVMPATLGDLRDVVGERTPQEALCVAADDEQPSHMGHVEHTGGAPYRMVLLDNPPVLDGQQPAAEVDDAAALLFVQVEERRLAKRRRVDVGHGAPEL